MAKTIPISASRAGLGSVIVVDSVGIVKTQALSASRAGMGGSVFSVDDGSGKTWPTVHVLSAVYATIPGWAATTAHTVGRWSN